MAATRDDNPNRVRWYLCIQGFLCVVLLLAVANGIALACVYGIPQTRYHISIDSASGLVPPPSSQDLALDPQFNITFRLASSSPGRRACVEAGTYVVVSYRCVPIAISGAATRRFCVGPRKSISMPIVAKGTGVRLPAYLMDVLAADLRSGLEAFEVTFFKLSGDNYNKDVASCGVRRVGDGAAECAQGHTCPNSRDQISTSSPLIISSTPVITN